MNNKANFFDSKDGDRKYTAEDFRNWLKGFFTNGVAANQLFVESNNGMSVKVHPGFTHINGYAKKLEEEEITIQPIASGALTERIDSIIVELDTENEDVEIKYGQDQTTPVRTGSKYQLIIAKIHVPTDATTSAYNLTQASIEDTRMDDTICGYIVRFIDKYSYTDELQTHTEYVDGFDADHFDEFEEWFAGVQDLFTPQVAANMQALVTALQGRVSDVDDKLSDETDEATSLTNRYAALQAFSKVIVKTATIPSHSEYSGVPSELSNIYGETDVKNYGIIAALPDDIDSSKVAGILLRVKLGTNNAFDDVFLTGQNGYYEGRAEATYYGNNGMYYLPGGGSTGYARTLSYVNSNTPSETAAAGATVQTTGADFRVTITSFTGKPKALCVKSGKVCSLTQSIGWSSPYAFSSPKGTVEDLDPYNTNGGYWKADRKVLMVYGPAILILKTQ